MNRFTNPKTFILGMKEDRPVLFTPTKYDAGTGMLYGFDNGERPVSIPMDNYLTPYAPVELEWEDDEPISKGVET